MNGFNLQQISVWNSTKRGSVSRPSFIIKELENKCKIKPQTSISWTIENVIK
jgi:hypothetical protein